MFLYSEKEGTAEGREGVSNCALASHFETPILVTNCNFESPRLTGQQRSRESGAGLSLGVTERAPSGDLEPQPRKRWPTDALAETEIANRRWWREVADWQRPAFEFEEDPLETAELTVETETGRDCHFGWATGLAVADGGSATDPCDNIESVGHWMVSPVV